MRPTTEIIPAEKAPMTTDKLIELVAWGAGLWIFLYFIMMKPIVARVTGKNSKSVNLGNQIF